MNNEEVKSTDDSGKVPATALFLAFLRLGLTAFGGPAMVVYMRDLAVSRRRWLSEGSFRGGVVLCQSIPGATAMQMAAYVGLRANGAAGALSAYVGFMLPAFVLMLALSAVYAATRDVPAIVSSFAGLRVIVVAIIANAAVNFGRKTIRRAADVPVTAASAFFLGFGGSPAVALLCAGLAGILLNGKEHFEEGSAHVGASSHSLKPVVIGLALLLPLLISALFLLDRRLALLSLIMVKVDALGFGGGFASVPLMMHEIVDARQWLPPAVFMDGIALGQVTPGPICITATFVGYQVSGWSGALAATLSIFATSFLVLLFAVPYFDRLNHFPWFRRAVHGILAAFVGLLLAVAVNFGLSVPWSRPGAVLGAAALACLLSGVDILWVVLAGGVASAFFL